MTDMQPGLRCPNGHPVRPYASFCPVCGTPMPRTAGATTGGAQPPGGERSLNRRIWSVSFLAVIAVLGAVAIGTAFVQANQRPARQSGGSLSVPTGSESGPSLPTPESSPTSELTSPSPTEPARRTVGIVDYTDATDGRAFDVARTLNEYFSGINTRTYERARVVIDPRSPINPQNPASWNTFIHDVSTTTDSDIMLHGVSTDTTGAGSALADVTFRSIQAPGYGPAGSEQETCTDWNLTYTLTEPIPRNFLIFEANGTHAPC